MVRGIDVSTYQGSVSWAHVADSGVAFAFARLSDGAKLADAEFANNWNAMKAAGIVRGSYQYFRAGEDAHAQASLALSMLNGAGGLLAGDLPVVMDIETADGQSNAIVRAQMGAWLDAMTQASGRQPIIYTNAATSSVIGPGFGNYVLWVANWGVNCPLLPDGWAAWRFWQYSDMGSIAGIAGTVDLDQFDGTLADLLSFASFASLAPGGRENDADAPPVDAAAIADALFTTPPCAP